MSNPFSLMFGKVPLENISLPLQKNQISEAFDNEPAVQQIFMISGIRGAGKTVLLTEICNLYRSKENWVVVELNPNGDLLQGLLIKLSNDSRCLNIIKSAKLNLSFWGIGLEIEGSTPITDTETAIMQILTNLQKAGKKVLVAIDEVTSNSQMHEFASAFQIMIRQNAPLYLLMTGLYENIDELQNEKSLTFLYRAPKIYLKGLNLGAVGRKYKSIFSLNDEQAREMAKLTKGYPFAFQVLGYLTYNNAGNYTSVISEYRQYLEDYVYDKIWSELSPKDKQITYAIAECESGRIIEIRQRLGIDTNAFNPYRKRLIRKGIINGDERGFVKFTLPMFKEYVLENNYEM